MKFSVTTLSSSGKTNTYFGFTETDLGTNILALWSVGDKIVSVDVYEDN
jgi:hypothetical protein